MLFTGCSAVLYLILCFVGGSNGLNCATSTLPVVPNSSNDASSSTTVPPGTVVIFTCNTNYRMAPADNPAVLSPTKTVTCNVDGSFKTFDFKCVYQHPSSCEDFFSRATDKSGTFVCVDVTIDPNGPFVEPGMITGTKCCKDSASEIETKIKPTEATKSTSIATCGSGGVFADLMPSTTFQLPISSTCDKTTVEYDVAGFANVEAIIKTTKGGCQQKVNIDCNGARAMATVIRYHGDASGIMYGASAYPERGDKINLDHYTYTVNGCGTMECECTTNGDEEDEIVKNDISAAHPAFVTHVGATQHKSKTAFEGTYNINVKSIKCLQAFP